MAEGVDLNNACLPDDGDSTSVAAEELPFGIVVLAGKALYRGESPWTTDLYRIVEPVSAKPLPIRLIPYFARLYLGPAGRNSVQPGARSEKEL